MYNDYPEVTKEEMLDLLDTEMFKQAYEERVFMGVCDRKTRLFYPDYFYGITQIDTPLPMAHMLAEEYMSRPYEDVDWARLTNFYDLNDMNMIAYLLYTKLVWKTPAEFTLLKDRFVIDGRIAVEVKDENYKWLDKLYEWQRKIEEEAILYFADNLPVWNEDDGDGEDYYCMEGMIEWNRITSSCIYLGKEFFPKINYLSISAFRENIKLIAKKRGGAKAAEIIRKLQEDWPDIVHWGCFGIHTISDKEVKYFQKSLFEGFNRELRKWESPNNEQTQSQTGNSVYDHCTFNTTNNYYGAQSSASDRAEDINPDDLSLNSPESDSGKVLFCRITKAAYEKGVAQQVDDDLRSACVSAPKLVKALNTNDALGYTDTKNLSSTDLYNLLDEHYGLPFKPRNFAKYRSAF